MGDWRKYFPWLERVSQKHMANLSTLWFLGLYQAPGTWGSFAGIIFVATFCNGMNTFSYLFICALLIYFAVGVCEIGEKYFKLKDPGKINFDEFAVMPLCYFGIFSGHSINGFAGVLFLCVGFAIFRFFDITKPFGIKKIQELDGGLGCVADDILAAVYTCISLNILKILFL